MRYPVRKDGEWFHIPRHGHYLACCDCGLVHLFRVKVKGGRVMLRAWRDNRKSAAHRRADLPFKENSMASRSANRAATKRAQAALPRNALAGMAMPTPPAGPQKAKMQVGDAMKGPSVPTPAKGMFHKSHRVGDRTK